MVMTTSRLALAALWISLGIHLWAQTDPAVVPTQWTWAYAEFQVDPTGPADSPWRITLPQLLVKGWEQPEKHVLTEPEKTAWRGKNLARQRLEIQKQLDQKALDRSRLLLGPKVKPAEVTAAEKAIADLAAQFEALDKATPQSLPESLVLSRKDAPGHEGFPSTKTSPQALELESGAYYLLTGKVKIVAGYLSVSVFLTSTLERKVLASWSSTFAPDEAPEQMVLARRTLQEVFLGRPWATLELTSTTEGTSVEVGNYGTETLPWRGETLSPGPLTLKIHRPGLATEVMPVDLLPAQVTRLHLQVPEGEVQTLLLTSEPSEASGTIDSRLLGLTPLRIPRPLSTARITVKLEGFAPTVLELGPKSAPEIDVVLQAQTPSPDVTGARDLYYQLALATTFSMAGAMFLREGADQAYKLALAYANGKSLDNFEAAKLQYEFTWYVSQATLALTTGVFVWMMLSLGDYLNAAQTPIP